MSDFVKKCQVLGQIAHSPSEGADPDDERNVTRIHHKTPFEHAYPGPITLSSTTKLLEMLQKVPYQEAPGRSVYTS